jgi:DNA-binding XRE family transcriptional regulator
MTPQFNEGAEPCLSRREPTHFDRHDFQLAFGKRLRATRDALGMSQSVLAHTAGYVPQTVSNIERGLTFPSLVAVFVFAEVLHIHPRELLFGKE